MTTHRLYCKPHVIWQTSGEDDGIPNEAVAVCMDNGGSLILRQGDAEIVLNLLTVDELCRLMKRLVVEELKKQREDK